jgi:hypothetical protein
MNRNPGLGLYGSEFENFSMKLLPWVIVKEVLELE